MQKLIKILHIDREWRVRYWIIRTGSLIRSEVPLKCALHLLKRQRFDLIISEPHHWAILEPSGATESPEPV
jgi:hypothetical protein